MLGYLRTKFKLLSTISQKKAAKEAFKLFCTPLTMPVKPSSSIFNTAEFLDLELKDNVLEATGGTILQIRKSLYCMAFLQAQKIFTTSLHHLFKRGMR